MGGNTFSVQPKVPRFVAYRIICDTLEWDGRLTAAAECFRQMQNELAGNAVCTMNDRNGNSVGGCNQNTHDPEHPDLEHQTSKRAV